MSAPSEITKRIIDTADVFVRVVWPVIQSTLGGGDLVAVEEVTDKRFAKEYLDKYAGIDCWQVRHDKSQIRGIARRVQRPIRKLFETFTIRHGNGRYACEFEKRLASMRSTDGWIRPAVMAQAYLTPKPNDQLRAVGIAYMDDLIAIVADGEQGTGYKDPRDWYMHKTMPGKYAEKDLQHFAVIPIETLRRKGCKVKWICD